MCVKKPNGDRSDSGKGPVSCANWSAGVGKAAIGGKTTLEKTFGQFLWLLVAEFDAENGIGHSNRLFDRFGIPFSEADLERYWDS